MRVLKKFFGLVYWLIFKIFSILPRLFKHDIQYEGKNLQLSLALTDFTNFYFQ